MNEVVGRFELPQVFDDYTSMLTPHQVLQFDSASGSSHAFEPPHLTFDPTLFEMERVLHTSKDGTRVPMFIAHRKQMVRDGQTRPCSTPTAGSTSRSAPSSSGPHRVARVGGVYAQPSIRGGSEYGEAWHHAGMFEKKQNVFDHLHRRRRST